MVYNWIQRIGHVPSWQAPLTVITLLCAVLFNPGMPNLMISRDRGIDRVEKQILEKVIVFEVLFILYPGSTE
jgi:hypothetical protein